MSFVDRVKAAGANAMLGVFTSTGERFDRALAGMNVTKISLGAVTCELVVVPGLQNTYGTLHGGATSTIVDVLGTMALLTQDPTKPGVSVEMNTSFLAAAKAGQTLRVEARVLKRGKAMGFTQVDIFRKDDGVLCATGRHTKVF